MKNKLKFLIKNSLNKKIKTKWFKIVNILLAVLIVGLINIDNIITYFGGDFNSVTKIYVTGNETDLNTFESFFNISKESLKDVGKFEIVKDFDGEEVSNKIKDGSDDILLNLEPSATEYLTVKMTTYEYIDTISYQLINAALNQTKSANVISNSNLTEDQIKALTSSVNIERVYASEDLEVEGEGGEIISTGIITVFIVPIFLLIVLLVQMIGAEINDEKTTRSMEIIISNVPPKVHFFSKIVASTGFVLIQAGLLIAYVLGGVLLRVSLGSKLVSSVAGGSLLDMLKPAIASLKANGVIEMLPYAIPLILIMLILSFLAYSLLAGILASMTTSIEDFQQLQTPLMIIMMVGYYLAIMASVFKGALFIKYISFVPFISSMLAPILLLMGETTIIEFIISILLMVGTCFLLFKYGLRVYKVGILNYSSKDLWKKVFKSMKVKE